MSMKITIVTPSFNQAKFLEETIRSVISQRDQIHEYFVLDGGSTDGSVDIIKKYADKIDWWVSEKDKGQSDAIHRGFTKATGDIIAWLNSDDVYLPGTIQKVQAAFNKHPEWDVVTGYTTFIDSDSRIERITRVAGGNGMLARWGAVVVAQQATFFRKRLYDRVGGLNLSLHCTMDRDLWSRFIVQKASWGEIHDQLAAFRHHGDAKGLNSTWAKRYSDESQLTSEAYPELYASCFKIYMARKAYQALQLLSGRHLYAWLQTQSQKGKPSGQVFPFRKV